MLHIYSAVVENERRLISERTKLSRNKIGVGRYTQDDWEFGVSQ
jgi:hypothetical protein